VRDQDTLTRDEFVGTMAISFDEAMQRHRSGKPATLRWYYLYDMGRAQRAIGKGDNNLGWEGIVYHATEAALTGNAGTRDKLLHNTRYFVSEWRGKLLLSVGIHTPKEGALPEKARASASKTKPPVTHGIPCHCMRPHASLRVAQSNGT
jgi:hypothetical protein